MARHRSLGAMLLALALLIAACAGGDDAVSTEAANPADDAGSEAAPAPDAGESDAMVDEADDTATAGEAMADDEAESESADPADTADTAGEDTSGPVTGPPPSLPPEQAAAAAEQNIPNLQSSDDVRDIEVVSVQDGSITSLREVVTGDRPVLVWFWAPH